MERRKEMQITNTLSSSYAYRQNLVNRRISGSQEQEICFSDAITKAEEEEKGKFLNLTTVGSGAIGHILFAMLPESSTPDNPIVQIISGASGKREVYNIDVSKVDPRNATEMEMFALCCYADETGRGSGDSLGSYHTLKMHSTMARYNDYTGKLNEYPADWEQFSNEKIDWAGICEFVTDVFKDSMDIKMKEFVLQGNKLLNFFMDHLKRYQEA